MNDFNGLCKIDGWYIFYQWFPLGLVYVLKHWYHVKTRDFVEYTDMGPAMFPDGELDWAEREIYILEKFYEISRSLL